MRPLDLWQSYRFEDHVIDYELSELADYEKEYFEERASILEYDGGFSKQESERLALAEVTKYWRN